MGTQKTPKGQTFLRKKNKAGATILPDFRLYYKATDIKAKCFRHKNRHTSVEQNKKPQMSPQLCGQLIYEKVGKNMQSGKDDLFSKCCGENWTAPSRRINLDSSLTPYTVIS